MGSIDFVSYNELLRPFMSDQGTQRYFSSVPDALRMFPCVTISIDTLPHASKTLGLMWASPFPSPYLQNDYGFSQYIQVIIKLNTSGQGSLKPLLSSQVPGEASFYAKQLWDSRYLQRVLRSIQLLPQRLWDLIKVPRRN